MTSETSYAWAAGIIDGEGSFWITRTGDRQYGIYLQVKMSCKETIERIQKIIGGTIYEYNSDMPSFKSPSGHDKSTQWGCRVSGRALPDMIERVSPYLVTKKKQAKVVGTFCTTIGNTGQPLTPAILKKREQCREQLTKLNKRQF